MYRYVPSQEPAPLHFISGLAQPRRETMGRASSEARCDAPAASVFIIGLAAGTICILVSKALFEEQARGVTGKVEPFRPPVFETFIMFFGMVFALPLYWVMELGKRIQAHGLAFGSWSIIRPSRAAQDALERDTKVDGEMLRSLAVPAVCDLSSVLLLMVGLMHPSDVPESARRLRVPVRGRY